MKSGTVALAFCAWLGLSGLALAQPEPQPVSADTLTRLVKGCSGQPTAAGAAELAAGFKATSYPAAKAAEARKDGPPRTVVDPSRPGQSQRTTLKTLAFSGWDLPVGGYIEFEEQDSIGERIETATGKLLGPPRIARTRACSVTALVASGRSTFELYETLHSSRYGLLVSNDRRRVVVFVYDASQHDIELSLFFEHPIPGVPETSSPTGISRLVLSDGGERFMDRVVPGIPYVNTTRGQLLAGLDAMAKVHFGNMAISVVAPPPPPPSLPPRR